jgi:hypothetical protein
MHAHLGVVDRPEAMELKHVDVPASDGKQSWNDSRVQKQNPHIPLGNRLHLQIRLVAHHMVHKVELSVSQQSEKPAKARF